MTWSVVIPSASLRSPRGLAPAGSANGDGSNQENPGWLGMYEYYAKQYPHKNVAEITRLQQREGYAYLRP